MNGWIFCYLSGVFVMIVLVIKENIGVKLSNIKFKAVMRCILAILGSWITVYLIARKNL